MRILQRYRDPALTALVLLELAWLFVLAPLEQLDAMPHAVNSIANALVIAVVLVVCSGNRSAELTVLVATAVDVAATLLRHVAPSDVTVGIDFAARFTFLLAVSIVVGRAVFAEGDITHHRVVGAIAIYLNVALTFAFLYRAIDAVVPHAFNIANAGSSLFGGRYVYFSFVTLTTTGYGDILPVHPFARSAATLEALFGQLFPATLLARLVSLHVMHTRGPRE
ncbi:MAG TPA: potassium channel family protein [Candidatus Baltobacteraceae bacterium]|nr:potassium channel family protein [Candidatus Baltobacteraceae bacterium]